MSFSTKSGQNEVHLEFVSGVQSSLLKQSFQKSLLQLVIEVALISASQLLIIKLLDYSWILLVKNKNKKHEKEWLVTYSFVSL